MHLLRPIQLTLLLSSVLLLLEPAAGQTRTFSFDHHLAAAPARLPAAISAVPETTRILVAMVEFQPDNDSRTTGTGTFDLSTGAQQIVDPPPHDRTYFARHMEFLQNYFAKSSHGFRSVAYTLLDSTFRMAHPMRYYSPSRTSTTNREIGLLMQDAWQTVDSLNPGFPFGQYDAFLLFHAGSGRDIDFVSIYGFDPTPFDIPSLYVNLDGLHKMFGATYDGIPVSGGAFRITNSMVIPETENHNLSSAGGPSLLELGINGLMAASVGSHLGLPDLFDTKTGATGIGRFGLMDGQSIFSWNGLFPPAPSAWERMALGWTVPVAIGSGDSIRSFPAAGRNDRPDTVYKALISAREYFLIENRNRDAHGDGVAVTMIRNGSPYVRTWTRDSVGFNFSNQDSLWGVVTDVDEFDWSLPGGVDANTGELYTGGLLIWHIDENVIDAGIASDQVNADPGHKGVDLMEADGSQDIGQSYGFLEPGSGSENGTPLDFWFAGNRAPLRIQSNVFGPYTQPSSRSSLNANSHITVSEFSARGGEMTARVSVGDAKVMPLAGFPKFTGQKFGTNSLTTFPQTNGPVILAATNGLGASGPYVGGGFPVPQIGQSSMYAWHSEDGTDFLPGTGGRAALSGGTVRAFVGKPGIGNFDANPGADLIIGANDAAGFETADPHLFQAWQSVDNNTDGLFDPILSGGTYRRITTAPVVIGTTVAFGAEHGTVYRYHIPGGIVDSIDLHDTSAVRSLSVSALDSSLFVILDDGNRIFGGVFCVQLAAPARPLGLLPGGFGAVGFFGQNQPLAVGTTRSGRVSLATFCSELVDGFPVETGGEILNAPAIADIDGDGSNDIVVFSGNKIYAINRGGSILDHFPITVQTSKPLLTSPVIGDVDGNGTLDIVAVTQEGLVAAYDKNGAMASGFPLQGGVNGGSTPALFTITPEACLSCPVRMAVAYASEDGNVYAWQTASRSRALTGFDIPWGEYLHDSQNSAANMTTPSGNLPSTEFFPAARAYNWPNPVGKEQAFKTHIRYFVRDDAQVHIKIFDIAGDLVAELNGPGRGGLDNEVEWDVSQIQSGVYLAHVAAEGTNGSGKAVIKIAVIK